MNEEKYVVPSATMTEHPASSSSLMVFSDPLNILATEKAASSSSRAGRSGWDFRKRRAARAVAQEAGVMEAANMKGLELWRM